MFNKLGFMDTDSNKYYILSDGSVWLKVFDHRPYNFDGTTNLFTSHTEALSCNKPGKYSILGSLSSYISSDNKYEFLLMWPELLPTKYNRWSQTVLPQDYYSSTYPVTVTGYTAIHMDFPYGSTASNFGGLHRQNSSISTVTSTLLSGDANSTWYCAIGAYSNWGATVSKMDSSTWTPTIPAISYNPYNGNRNDIHARSTRVVLYIRLDTCANKTTYANALDVVKSASGGRFCDIGNVVDGKNVVSTITDGSKWVRLFYHHISTGVFTCGEQCELSLGNMNKFSILSHVYNYKSTDGYYEFIYRCPAYSSTMYNRWKQTNAPQDALKYSWNGSAWAIKSASPITGYTAISIGSSTYWTQGLARQNSTSIGGVQASASYLASWYNSAPGNWWGALGSFSLYSSGIPGINGATCQDVELWVRADNTALYKNTVGASISKTTGNVLAREFVEI